jgi:hypothetical protein
MTPKEKAEELVNKFTIDLAPFSEYGKWDKLQGKTCALIAVDELISADWICEVYWKIVKQEIENFKQFKQQDNDN